MAKKVKKEIGGLVLSGKRKKAIAKASIKKGKGVVKINKVPVELVEPQISRLRLQEVLQLAGPLINTIDINVKISGGGSTSQIEAARLAIAKVLVKHSSSEDLKNLFLKYDRHLLVADTRRNEPHKPNDSKPRAKRQKSYR